MEAFHSTVREFLLRETVEETAPRHRLNKIELIFRHSLSSKSRSAKISGPFLAELLAEKNIFQLTVFLTPLLTNTIASRI